MLSGNCRDARHGRKYSEFFALYADGKILFFHITLMAVENEARYLEIRKAHNLCFTHNVSRNCFYAVKALQYLFKVYYVLQFLYEPLIYFCQTYNLVDAVTIFQCLRYGKDTQVGRVGKFFFEILEVHMVISYKTVHPLANHSKAFLYQFLESAA